MQEALKIILHQYAGLIIISLAAAIAIIVCFVAFQYRKMRETDSALVLQAAILSRGGTILTIEREIIPKPSPYSNLFKLFKSVCKIVQFMLLTPLLLVSLFLFLILLSKLMGGI
jgi:hypothetical protein